MDEEDLEEIKLYLRCTLVASDGIPQSKVGKEYYDQTGDKLVYSRLGFDTIYEFLVSLEGEVTRLEFSPKHGENLVYAVLDKTKYASAHAKKYANKSKTGLKHKSPIEVAEWRRQQEERGIAPPPLPTNKKPAGGRGVGGRKRGNQGRGKPGRRNGGSGTGGGGTGGGVTGGSGVGGGGSGGGVGGASATGLSYGSRASNDIPAEIQPPKHPVNEWVTVGQILPESEKKFTLKIQDSSQGKPIQFTAHSLNKQFDMFNVIKDSTKLHDGVITASFPSFFTAYRAWKEKHMAVFYGQRISIEPANGNLNALKSCCHVIVTHIPLGLKVQQFVTKFSKFNNLVSIQHRGSPENCVLIYYTKTESAVRACTENVYVKINDASVRLNVVMGDDRPISSVSSPAGIRQPLLPTPSYNTSGTATVCGSTPAAAVGATVLPTPSYNTLSTATVCGNTPAAVVDASVDVAVTEDSLEDRVCGFPITYEQWLDMFLVTQKKPPLLAADAPEELKFLVTYQTDCIRFWGWLVGSNDANKLVEIEAKMNEGVKKIEPPMNLPQPGCRGAGLFEERWYRCYVLSCDIDSDEIEVFFLDYGNSEIISRNSYRSTFNEWWRLAPQARPFKLHGYEVKQDVAATPFLSLSTAEPMQAQVVKNSTYSENHIIEIKNIAYTGSENTTIDSELISDRCIPTDEISVHTTDDEHTAGTCESETDIEKKPHRAIESIYDYDEPDLIFGLLNTVHSPQLIYLKLGDNSVFQRLMKDLDEVPCRKSSKVSKAKAYLLFSGGERRRVLVLQEGVEQVRILHVDYGDIEWVKRDVLMDLSQVLRDTPFQARPASLAGIDCSAKKEEAMAFLRGMSRRLIKVNVINESTSGKVNVELFDVEKNISVNHDLIQRGLATRAWNQYVDTDDEVTPQKLTAASPVTTQHAESNGSIDTTTLSLKQNPVVNTGSVGRTADHNEFHKPPLEDLLKGYQSTSGPTPSTTSDSSEKLQNVQSWLTSSPLHGPSTTNSILNGHGSVDLSQRVEDAPVVDKTVECRTSFYPRVEDQSLSHIQAEEAVCRVQDERVSQMEKKEIPFLLDVVIPEGSFDRNNHLDRQEGRPSQINGNRQRPQENCNKNNTQHQYPSHQTNPLVPDIISSSTSNSVCSSTSFETMPQFAVDDDPHSITFEDGDVINFGPNDAYDPNKANRIHYKWRIEKFRYIEMEKKLNSLLEMPAEQLKEYYKNMKKDKLQWKIRVQKSRKKLAELQKETEEIDRMVNSELVSV